MPAPPGLSPLGPSARHAGPNGGSSPRCPGGHIVLAAGIDAPLRAFYVAEVFEQYLHHTAEIGFLLEARPLILRLRLRLRLSEARRVGYRCVRSCRSLWSPY